MPQFPRTLGAVSLVPQEVTWPKQPDAFRSVGESGKGHLRSHTAVGRTWSETFPPLDGRLAEVRQFLTLIDYYARSGTILTVDHRLMRKLLGAGTGTPRINSPSAPATGSSLPTDGWTNGNGAVVLKAGDIFTIAGINVVFFVTADATVTGGAATVSIDPPLFVGGGAVDNALLTLNQASGADPTVLFRAVLAGVQMPRGVPPGWLAGLTLTWQEWP